MISPSRFFDARTLSRQSLLLLGLSVFLAASGCRIFDWWFPGDKDDQPVMPLLPADITARELGDHINRNSEKLFAWRSTNVKVQTKGPGSIPIKLSANLAVESPRNFRLIARSLAGTEADLGSNQDRFWFWMKRAQPPHVITVKHEHMPMVQRTFELPFQPDWLMESLGVIPVDTSQARILDAGEKTELVRLETQHRMPSGKLMTRVFDVNKITGFVIYQGLYDAQNQLLASATFHDHQTDEAKGITLPHRIDLNWPQVGMELTLHIGDVEINPGYIPQNLWELPHIPNSPVMDMGERLARQQQPQLQQPQGTPLGGLNRELRTADSSTVLAPGKGVPNSSPFPPEPSSEIPDFSEQVGFEKPVVNPDPNSGKQGTPAWWDK